MTPDFQSLPNFRELVPGKLYRSSAPDNVTASDVDKFKSLGVKAIVDLRSLDEYQRTNAPKLMDNTSQVVEVTVKGRKLPELQFTVQGTGADNDRRHYIISMYGREYFTGVLGRRPWYKRVYFILMLIVAWIVDTILRAKGEYTYKVLVPFMLSTDQGMLQWCKDMVDFSSGTIFAALQLLSDPQNQPTVFCCAHGKDRTGMVAAVVLGMLGRPREDIVEDYNKSEEGTKQLYTKMYNDTVVPFGVAESYLWARKETMQQLLDYIDQKYGSVDSYLLSIGFSMEDVENMRGNLLG